MYIDEEEDENDEAGAAVDHNGDASYADFPGVRTIYRTEGTGLLFFIRPPLLSESKQGSQLIL